jgi:DNA-binding YbaB/EbfC family protein
MNIPGMGNMMKQIQKMQDDMKRSEEELSTLEITGKAGGGLVSVTLYVQKKDCKAVEIDPSLLTEDKQMLEDLLVAAFNKASQEADRIKEERLGQMTSGFKMPPGLDSFLK